VAAAGDVNGDGYSDIIVGAYFYANGQPGEGRAFLYLGSASGPSTSGGWSAEPNQAFARLGYSVGSAGDVNGDGYDDLIVGAPLYDNGELDEGRAIVYYGSALGPYLTPGWIGESNQSGAHYGAAVGTAGDVNGDGFADVIVGAPLFTSQVTRGGRTYLYLGAAYGLSPASSWTATGGFLDDQFGTSVGTAGDVNGDGFADLIVGAPSQNTLGARITGFASIYLGTPSGPSTFPVATRLGPPTFSNFGLSASTVGDVNRDGRSDVIIGAPDYDQVYTNEGAAYIYTGTSSGISSSPGWAVRGDNPNAKFGYSVATAGDVNGDGYADVLVGAPGDVSFPFTAGKAYVFAGTSPAPYTSAFWIAESGQPTARFGWSVSTAGDVNGDGLSDVFVGAPVYSNGVTTTGAVFGYNGTITGPSPSPSWTLLSTQGGSKFGFSVASAGDVNGDGFADVIVGADMYQNVETEEGRASFFYGNGGPTTVLNPQQRRADDAGLISPLGSSDSDSGFRVALLTRSPFGRTQARLEWEIRPLGNFFGGPGLHVTPTWLDTGTTGVIQNDLVTGLTPATVYHWRARARYHAATSPFLPHGPWFTVPINGWRQADLRTPAAPVAAGHVPDGATYPGAPLEVTRDTSGNLTLTWSASCTSTDGDYEIYAGTIGDFTSHLPLACTTAGATQETFLEPAGDVYFLVVPRNTAREGSYGLLSDGTERPTSAASCVAQMMGVCAP